MVWPRHGRPIVLTSKHFLGIGRFEDRLVSFRPFAEALILTAILLFGTFFSLFGGDSV